MTAVVLLNSGGVDSRVSAAMLVASGMEVHSLTLDWNPSARGRVLRAAEQTAKLYAVDHTVFPYPFDWMTYSAALKRKRMPFVVFTAVAIGAQYAATRDILWLATGRRGATVEVPSTSTDQMQEVLNQSRVSDKITLLNPVFDMRDADIDAKARELNVELRGTVSCLEAVECGVCVSCERRRRYGYEEG